MHNGSRNEMLAWLLASSFFLLTLPVCSSDDEQHLFQQLLMKRTRDGVIHLNDAALEELVLPATSGLFILFFDKETAVERSVFSDVAYSFHRNHPSSQSYLFASMALEDSRKSWQKFNLTSVASVVYLRSDGIFKLLPTPLHSPEQLAMAINSETGEEVGPISSPPTLSAFQVVVLLLLLAIAAPAIFRAVTQPLRDARFWCAGAIVVYLFAASGGVFSSLYQVPGTNWSFFRGQDGQVGVEVAVIGTLYAVPSFILAFFTHVLPKRRATEWTGILMLAAMILCCLSVAYVCSLYQWKSKS